MSKDRGDCEHACGHEAVELAMSICEAHGLAFSGAVLVITHPTGEPSGIGKFNTSTLADAGRAVLAECAKHEPDGCVNCDHAAEAAQAAIEILHAKFAEHMKARSN